MNSVSAKSISLVNGFESREAKTKTKPQPSQAPENKPQYEDLGDELICMIYNKLPNPDKASFLQACRRHQTLALEGDVKHPPVKKTIESNAQLEKAGSSKYLESLKRKGSDIEFHFPRHITEPLGKIPQGVKTSFGVDWAVCLP